MAKMILEQEIVMYDEMGWELIFCPFLAEIFGVNESLILQALFHGLSFYNEEHDQYLDEYEVIDGLIYMNMDLDLSDWHSEQFCWLPFEHFTLIVENLIEEKCIKQVILGKRNLLTTNRKLLKIGKPFLSNVHREMTGEELAIMLESDDPQSDPRLAHISAEPSRFKNVKEIGISTRHLPGTNDAADDDDDDDDDDDSKRKLIHS